MTSLGEALLNSEQREALAQLFGLLRSSKLDRHREAVMVLQSDQNAPDHFWAKLADRAFRTPLHTADEAEALIADECRSHLLKGDPHEVRAARYGRLRQFDVVVDDVASLYGLSDALCEELLWAMVRGADLSFSEHFPDVPLGQHLMWSTFSETAPEGLDPFFPLDDSSQLPNQLGLSIKPGRKEAPIYLVLAFRLPSSIVPRIPTIADAYAGGLRNVNFRPHGRTRCAYNPDGELEGRPESVHDVVTGAMVVARPGAIPDPGWPNGPL